MTYRPRSKLAFYNQQIDNLQNEVSTVIHLANGDTIRKARMSISIICKDRDIDYITRVNRDGVLNIVVYEKV